MSRPTQITVAESSGVYIYEVAQALSDFYATRGRPKKVTLGAGETVNGIPHNTIVMEDYA